MIDICVLETKVVYVSLGRCAKIHTGQAKRQGRGISKEHMNDKNILDTYQNKMKSYEISIYISNVLPAPYFFPLSRSIVGEAGAVSGNGKHIFMTTYFMNFLFTLN